MAKAGEEVMIYSQKDFLIKTDILMVWLGLSLFKESITLSLENLHGLNFSILYC
jgi:hypothetical protein